MTTHVDFLSAMNLGINAHGTAESNQREVEAVLERLGSALTEFLASPTRVTRRRWPRFVTDMVGLQTVKDGAELTALALEHDHESHFLCEWEESALVFPVTLRFSKTVETAHDAEALEHALASLVATPKVGGILRQLKDKGSAGHT